MAGSAPCGGPITGPAPRALLLPSRTAHCGGAIRRRRQQARRGAARAGGDEDSELGTDWGQELAIFKQRTLKPSQLEVLRKRREEEVDIGRVSGGGGGGGGG